MILALSGSLNPSSINGAVLRAAASAGARDGILVTVDNSVRALPHFDPSLEEAPPEAVVRFRAACESAAGVLLAVPEYAFGIPGAFKNALDWTVGSGSLYRKPVAVLSVAPPGRGMHVREALRLVLRALDADDDYHWVPVARSDLRQDGEVDDPRILAELAGVVRDLAFRAPRLCSLKRPSSSNARCLHHSAGAQPALRDRRHNGEKPHRMSRPFLTTTRQGVDMAVAVHPFEGTYELDPNHSSFQFEVTHLNLSTFRASFAEIHARLADADGALVLEGQARAESISIVDPEFREHVVHGADFFEADVHPLISFRSTSVELGDDRSANVSGELLIRGVSRPVTASGSFAPPTTDPFGLSRGGLELRATVDRRNWDLNWQLPLPDGSDAVGWDVEITAHLELVQKA